MRVDRIQKLKDYRIFHDFTWPADLPNFGKFNLIYGWNGVGKTSLSTLFRHMQFKAPPIAKDIQVIVNGTSINGKEFETSELLPTLRVFNRDFVDQNVFENPKEKEFPPVYFLGEDNAEKQKKIYGLKLDEQATNKSVNALVKSLKETNAELNSYCTNQARSIRNLLLGDSSYNNYEAPRYKEKISELDSLDTLPASLLPAERSKLESTINAKLMERISESAFEDLDLTTLTTRVQEVLSQTVVTRTISSLVENPDIAIWIQHGLELHKNTDTCLFCNQLLPVSRIDNLEAHFSDQFKEHQELIKVLVEEIENLESIIKSRELPLKSQLYEHIRANYEKALSTFKQQSGLLLSYLSGLKSALNAKLNEPFKKLHVYSFITNSADSSNENSSTLIKVLEAVMIGFSSWGAMLGAKALDNINEIIKTHNNHTDNFDKEAKSARATLEQDEILDSFAGWKALQIRLNEVQSNLQTTNKSLASIKNEITALERDIRQHRKPAEEFNAELASYLGRDELRFEVKDNGYTISRGDQPAVHLSDGERTSIAFMYFLKSLRDTAFDIQNGIIVIDDPVSSLDANSLYCAFGYMKAYTRDASQLFVLTHNFAFFRQVKNWFNAEGGFLKKAYNPAKATNVHFYMLNCDVTDKGRSAKLVTLDPLLHAHESEYHYLFRCVQDGAAKGLPKSLSEVYGMPNIARRLLESFLAFRVPGRAGELRQQVESLKGDSAKKSRIIRFLHTYSHSDRLAEPEHDLSLLSETPIVLKEILELIKINDQDHFDAMSALIAP